MNREEQLKFIQDNYPATKHHMSNRELRHEFFDKIETEIQAYLLGFYVADGNVNEHRKTLRITLSEIDKEIIELYKIFISPDAYTRTYSGHLINGRNGETYKQNNFYSIDITSSKLVQSIVNLGYGYRKTYSYLHLPKINDELMWHFIRGYFDGDGTIQYNYRKANNGRKETIKPRFSICSKTCTMFSEIQKFFSKYDISLNIHYTSRDDMYRLCTDSKEEVKKIYKLLYHNANFYLTRKYNKYTHYVNTEVTLLIAEYRNALKVSASDSNNPSKSAEHPTIEDENVR